MLEARLRTARPDIDALIQAVGLAELDPGALAAVLDQLSRGADFPMVLVGETVVTTGSLDAAAVAAALS